MRGKPADSGSRVVGGIWSAIREIVRRIAPREIVYGGRDSSAEPFGSMGARQPAAGARGGRPAPDHGTLVCGFIPDL
jgi:hypothetical protein